jgi:hypothetical protein
VMMVVMVIMIVVMVHARSPYHALADLRRTHVLKCIARPIMDQISSGVVCRIWQSAASQIPPPIFMG